jgi:hypothetical protein
MTSAHGVFVLIALLAGVFILGLIAWATLTTIAETVAFLWREHREKKQAPWRVCRKCGYNVIASRGRCPECAEPIPPWPKPRIRVVRGFVTVERQRRQDQWS